jgi:signal transduction histidine kinase
VFVFDLEGRLIASGGWPETVGARIGDGAGGGIYARMRRLALDAGKGWIEYSWYNPCTRQMEPKASYIVRVGDFIVGVGAYKKPGV